MAERINGRYDYIVVGCGGIGSATVYHLAKRVGNGVLGLEQFTLGHNHGGSQDLSRAIRLTYSSSEYVSLARAAYEDWAEVEKESGIQLVFRTGSLDIADRKNTIGHRSLESLARSMKLEGVPFERYEGQSVRTRFPQFDATPDWTCLYQRDSGLVDAAMANGVHTQLARKNGATILENTAVVRITTQGNLTKVRTTKGDFLCRKVIVTAGAWMNEVLASVGVNIPLTVTQEQVTYFATPNIKEFTKDRCPVFFMHTGVLCPSPYFLPIHGNTGFKIGLDVGGPVVSTATRSYAPDPAREETARKFVEEIVPRALGPILFTKTCLYTLTPDRNFVIDNCSQTGFGGVIFCCGAGHAYKFASVLGKILSQLAIDGRSTHDISSFNMNRRAIQDPNYPPAFGLGGSGSSQDACRSKL